MPRYIDVPGHDQPVEFPDTMSDADIVKVIQGQSAGFPKQKGEFSQTAKKRLATLQTETARDQYGKDIFEAQKAFAKETVPQIAATVATMGAGGAAVAGKAGWSLFRSLAANAAERTALATAAAGGAALGLGATGGEAARTALTEGAGQAVGESIGMGLRGIYEGGKGAVKMAQNSRYGRALAAAKAESKIAIANETANDLANEFGKPVGDSSLTQSTTSFSDTWDKITKEKVSAAYTMVKESLANRKANISDVADEILKVEDVWKKYRGKAGLSPLTKPKAEWEELVDAMSKGEKKLSKTITTPASTILTESGVPMREASVVEKVGKTSPNMRENAAALVTARGTAQQSLNDLKAAGQMPRELEVGLQRLIDMADAKIAAIDHGAGEAMDLAKSAFANRQRVIEQGIYKAMKTSGDTAAARVMDGTKPNNAKQFMSMIKSLEEVNPQEAADMLGSMRRKVFDELITARKGNNVVTDIGGVNQRLLDMGESAKTIFGEKAHVVDNLQKIAGATADSLKVPKVTGGDSSGHVGFILSKLLVGAGGAALGYSGLEHGGLGAAAGFGGSLLLMKASPRLILKMAESDPKVVDLFVKGLGLFEKNPALSATMVKNSLRAALGKEELQQLTDALKAEAQGKKP